MEFRQGADDPCRYNQSVINFEENMEMAGGESVRLGSVRPLPAPPWRRRGPPRQSTSVIPPGPQRRQRRLRRQAGKLGMLSSPPLAALLALLRYTRGRSHEPSQSCP